MRVAGVGTPVRVGVWSLTTRTRGSVSFMVISSLITILLCRRSLMVTLVAHIRKLMTLLSPSPRTLPTLNHHLRTTCERAERTLSPATQTSIEIDSIRGYRLLHLSHSCPFRVLIGGSTRIPYIVKLVSDFFDGKEPNKSINLLPPPRCHSSITWYRDGRLQRRCQQHLECVSVRRD